MNTTSVRTENIVLAAYLICTNHNLSDMQVNTLGKGTFCFASVQEKTLLVFQAGGALCEPTMFNNTVAELSKRCRALSRRY